MTAGRKTPCLGPACRFLACGVFSFGAVSGNAAPLPPHWDLPRLRLLWSAPFLLPIRFDERIDPVRDGTYLGWKPPPGHPGAEEHTLVSLDARTGKENWRMPGFSGREQVVFAGDLALVQHPKGDEEEWEGNPDSIPTLALELRACKVRWTAPLPRLQADLHVSGPAGRETGIGICPNRKDLDAAGRMPELGLWTRRYDITRTAVAIDLRTGKILWTKATGLSGGALAADGNALHLAVLPGGKPGQRTEMLSLDPRSGSVQRSIPVDEPDPRFLHILPGSSQAVLVGHAISGLRLADGHILWQKSRLPKGRLDAEPMPVIHGSSLILYEEPAIRVFDAVTGIERGRYPLPGPHHGYRPPHLLPGPGPDNLLVLLGRKADPDLAARFARLGSPPTLATLPDPSTVLSAWDTTLILYRYGRGNHWMEGYSTLATAPPESKLGGPERVRAFLDRNPGILEMQPRDRRDKLSRLRKIPGVDTLVAALAGDTAQPLQQDALLAAIALGVPGLAALLRAEAARPLRLPDTSILQPPKARPGSAPKKPRRRSRFHNVMPTIPWEVARASRIRDSVASLLRKRGRYLSSLAALDDTAAVGLLAPMLFAARSPAGFGREDWEPWGYRSGKGYGRQSWPAAGSNESGHSGCLQGPAGRPEIHADVYRMLARLGRPSDQALLERFDSSHTPAGWADLCAADDALRKPYVDGSPWPHGSGMCLGSDTGPYRLAQVGAIWLRRRDRGGSWGPPAWAHDPGGDLIGDLSPLRKARIDREGKIALSGNSLRDMIYERSWSVTVDPGRVFADADRDGMTDGTEKVLGTDPKRADTDGDGLPDGRDPAPRAGPARTEEGRVADEAVHYLTVFRVGGPISLYADRKYWGGGGMAGAGIVLHWTRRDDRLPDCMSGAFCADGRSEESRARSRRRCEALLAIDSIEVRGHRAEATVTIADNIERYSAHRLEMTRVGGRWRVTGDRTDTQ